MENMFGFYDPDRHVNLWILNKEHAFSALCIFLLKPINLYYPYPVEQFSYLVTDIDVYIGVVCSLSNP